jgi:UDP-N-acetylglucosamine--N-acetylmuramyl-(pentapeptide) pyrophosphoryl-undecaprenol N-acetylglucosamine transferase
MQNSSRVPIFVAAGGTGGDLFPVLAVVEELERTLQPKTVLEPMFIGNPRRIEGQVIPARGYQFIPIPMRGYYGLGRLRTYSLAWRLPVSLARVVRGFVSVRPRVALLAGSYLSLPVALVARSVRIPIVVVEINAVPGKVNRIVSRWAERILVSVPSCRDGLPRSVQGRVSVVGTPIRSELRTLPDAQTARRRFGLETERPVLLVLGGSLGARSINQAVETLVERILAAGWQILWQTGAEFHTPSRAGVVARPFIEDMASAYAAAELVLSRAGGSTVAELTALGKAAILVPYPHAANREQHYNAEMLVAAKAAVMVDDAELTTALWPELSRLLHDEHRRLEMARAARSIGVPDAAVRAASEIAALISNGQ